MQQSSDIKPHTQPIVLIAGSAGGIEALITVLGALPREFQAPVVIVQHRSATHRSMLPSILARRSALPVVEAHSGEAVKPGVVYVARSDEHLSRQRDAGPDRLARDRRDAVRHLSRP